MDKLVKIIHDHWTQLGFQNYEGYHSVEFIYKNDTYVVCPDMMAYHVSKNNQWLTEYSAKEILSLDIDNYYNLMCIICVGINMR